MHTYVINRGLPTEQRLDAEQVFVRDGFVHFMRGTDALLLVAAHMVWSVEEDGVVTRPSEA